MVYDIFFPGRRRRNLHSGDRDKFFKCLKVAAILNNPGDVGMVQLFQIRRGVRHAGRIGRQRYWHGLGIHGGTRRGWLRCVLGCLQRRSRVGRRFLTFLAAAGGNYRCPQNERETKQVRLRQLTPGKPGRARKHYHIINSLN